MHEQMIFCVTVYLAITLSNAINGQMTATESYSHSATLTTGNIRIYWKFNDSHITFEVHGETTGWIGIGFSPNGAMTGSDIFVGWVKNDEVKVTDRHGVANAFPPLDPQQDIDVLGGVECDGWTMFKFSRQLAACEVEHDREITEDETLPLGFHGSLITHPRTTKENPWSTGCDLADIRPRQTSLGINQIRPENGFLAFNEGNQDHEVQRIRSDTQRLIWAWGDDDPTGDDIDPSHYHGTQRGVESMFFLQTSETPSGLADGPTYSTFDALMDKFELPAEDTYYNCKLFKLPELTKKHHIVKFEPIIQEGNELNVHHIVIYRCSSRLEDPSELRKDARCFSPNIQHFRTCATVIAAWAIGAGATFFPENAGLSIGDEGDPIYIQINSHYDNPSKKSGIIDSSGIRFTYTDTLRQDDIGVLTVGTQVIGLEHIIPPGAENFLSVGHCIPHCLDMGMTASGVNEVKVFSVFLHSHLAGRALKLRQIRNGTELPTPAYDDNYDFNYQEPRYLHPHLTLKPTDILQIECVYNTKDRINVTQGGLGTMDEMCLAALYHYPKIALTQCFSTVQRQASWKFFGVDANSASPNGLDYGRLETWSIPGADIKASKTMLDRVNEFDWNPQSIKTFETFYNSMLHGQLCMAQNNSLTFWTMFNVTEITSPYIEQQKTCDEPYLSLSQKISARECPSSVPTITRNMDSSTSGTSVPRAGFGIDGKKTKD